jgi:methionyl-tRNA formyltransferase
MIERIILFGDNIGLPQLLRHLPKGIVVGLVAAEIRPEQHETVSTLAAKLNIPFFIHPDPASFNYSAFVKKIQTLNPYLIIVNSYSMLLSKEILSIPKYGAVNIHGALLPQYRGANPIQWALINNERESGVTMHYMTKNFDQGDIIAQKRVPIDIQDTWIDIRNKIEIATEEMLSEEMPKILLHKNSRKPQDETTASLFPRRHPEDGLIDWSQSVLAIYNLIRALVKPHPGAFYFNTEGKKIILDKYLSIPELSSLKYSMKGGCKTLSDEEIILTPLTIEDYHIIADQEALLDNFHGIESQTIKQRMDDLSELEELLTNNYYVFFGIYKRKANEFVGFCSIFDMNFTNRSARLSFHLTGVDSKNRFFAVNVIRLAFEYARKELLIHSVFSQVLDSNHFLLDQFNIAQFYQVENIPTNNNLNEKDKNERIIFFLKENND